MWPVELPHLLHWLHELRPRHVRRVFRAVVASGTALAQHALGNASEEQRALDELRERFGDRDAWDIALVYSWRGDRDRALEWLDRSYAQHNIWLRAVKVSPLLKNVRGDPRYKALLARMNLPVE